MGSRHPPGPVAAPPVFQHHASDQPRRRPDVRPEIRREKSRMSDATLSQMVDVNTTRSSEAAGIAAMTAWKGGRPVGDQDRVNTGAPLTPQTSANRDPPVVADPDAPIPNETRPIIPERDASQHSISRKPLPRASSQQSVTRKSLPSPITSETPMVPPIPKDMTPTDARPETFSSPRDEIANAENYRRPSSDDTRIGDSSWEKSIPRQRGGVLKTVGDTNAARAAPELDIPVVDFGVTQSLTPTPDSSRPGTAAGRKSPLEPLTPPPFRRVPSGAPGLQDGKRQSYIDTSLPPADSSHSRSSSAAWRPGSVAGSHSPGPALSPEEYVQQMAAAARVPQGYLPHRSSSSSRAEQTSPSSLRQKMESYSRPQSRGSPAMPEFSSRLSARDQEQVARMTGAPLLSASATARSPEPATGLIGAIGAREQEKRNLKDNIAGQMVQEAMIQRQQHVQAQAMAAQRAAERAFAESHNQMPQAMPSPWNGLQPQQPQQQWPGQQDGPQPVQFRQRQQWVPPSQAPQQRYSGSYSQQYGGPPRYQ